MGNAQSMKKINFEDVQSILTNSNYLLINTLIESEQQHLIINTVSISQEETILNTCLKTKKNVNIVIYGRNCNDEKIHSKYQQLKSLGFSNIYVYIGGLFEWLMLQDIYGFENFPTLLKYHDFLKYKPSALLNVRLIGN
jgi:hypothetical protein